MHDSALTEDTIAAVSTAPGRAGIALVRLSGPRAIEIGARVGATAPGPRETRLTTIRHPDGRRLDHALVTRFDAPASFTGQDTIEISTHGGALVPALVLDALCAAGARVAERGEFTRRAFLHGKLDLIQVEATLDLIDAGSEAHHRAALWQLEGALSGRIAGLRDGLLELRALIGYDIDFPGEDDGAVPRDRIGAAAAALERDLEALVAGAPEGERLRDGLMVVLAGAPNSGKSSVFNHLLGVERAIVTEIPGTTRDAIEASTTIEGYPFRLVDTAGVRPGAEPIEQIGIEVARRYLGHADAVLLCVEAVRPPSSADTQLAAEVRALGGVVITLRTKGDLLDAGRDPVGREAADGEGITVSVRTGEGVPALRHALLETGFAGLRRSEEPALVTRSRQTRALRAAASDVREFREVFEAGHPSEIAGAHLEDAAVALDSVVGVADVEEVLGAIFSTFCVGK